MEASFIRIGVSAPLATIEESDTDTDGSSESDVEEEEDGVHNVDQVDGPEVEDKKAQEVIILPSRSSSHHHHHHCHPHNCHRIHVLTTRRRRTGSTLSLDVARAQAR